MRFGFIGAGNMGGAIAGAVCAAAGAENVVLADVDQARAQTLAGELGCIYGSNQLAAACDYVFLAVKPQFMEDMLADLAPALKTGNPILVTMAAGLPMKRILEMAGGSYRIIRIMPNTPAAIGAGMILYCGQGVSEEEYKDFLDAMRFAGRLDALPEKLIDAASCVSGCGPAFVYQFIEALADGAVACGLPRQKAQDYAAQMVLGSAKMVLEAGKHPGELKDAVCSPGGSTIQGVRTLEERAFRGAVTDAVIAAYDKTVEMSKK